MNSVASEMEGGKDILLVVCVEAVVGGQKGLPVPGLPATGHGVWLGQVRLAT